MVFWGVTATAQVAPVLFTLSTQEPTKFSFTGSEYTRCSSVVTSDCGDDAISSNTVWGSSYRVYMPSRFSTPRPPFLCMSDAKEGDTTASMDDAKMGMSKTSSPMVIWVEVHVRIYSDLSR